MKCITVGLIIMGVCIQQSLAQTDFSKEALGRYMDSVGIKHIPLSMAQAIHESANFRSVLFLKSNNIFGMKVPVYRETLAIGKTKGGYAIYYSWKDSVLDFYLLQQNILKKYPTHSQYLYYIYWRYAEDKLYKQKLQKYIK